MIPFCEQQNEEAGQQPGVICEQQTCPFRQVVAKVPSPLEQMYDIVSVNKNYKTKKNILI